MYVRVASVYVNLPRRLVLRTIVGGKLVPMPVEIRVAL